MEQAATMRALVLEDYGRMALQRIAEPVAGDGEVVIQVAYSGICGTDVHGYTGHNGRRRPGQVMGHEAAGVVVEVGSGDRGMLGRPVTFNPVIGCTQCEACRDGAEQRCSVRRVIGVDPTIVSALAERVVVPERNVQALPDGVPARTGALTEPVAVALHALQRVRTRAGDAVAVLGGGPIGQAAVFAALRLGARCVVVTEPDPARRAVCESLGATAVAPGADVVAQVRAHIGGPADVAVDAVGLTSSLRDALAVIKDGGLVGLVGMGAQVLEVESYAVTTDEKSVIGCYCYTPACFAEATALLAGHVELADRMIAAVVDAADAPAMFERLAGRADVPGKVLVRFGQDVR